MRALTVIQPFGGHAVGDQITDPSEVSRVQEGEHAHHVVAVDLPDQPADKNPADATAS